MSSVKKREHLGHVVSKGEVAINPAKVKEIWNEPAPDDTKLLKYFLGLARCYRRLTRDFSKNSAALFLCTLKNIHFEWMNKINETSNEAMGKMSSPPVLLFLIFDQLYTVETDVSYVAVGAALSRKITLETYTDPFGQLVHERSQKEVHGLWKRITHRTVCS